MATVSSLDTSISWQLFPPRILPSHGNCFLSGTLWFREKLFYCGHFRHCYLTKTIFSLGILSRENFYPLGYFYPIKKCFLWADQPVKTFIPSPPPQDPSIPGKLSSSGKMPSRENQYFREHLVPVNPVGHSRPVKTFFGAPASNLMSRGMAEI